MALPNTVPASYSVPQVTRYGLVNILNIVNVHAYNSFFEKYNFMPYMTVMEIEGNEEESTNKQFLWYEEHGRNMDYVASSNAQTVSAGAAITVTIAAGFYWGTGSVSLPDVGMKFRNAQTGVQLEVTAVNKTTPNAHTFTAQPFNTTDNASYSIGNEFLSMGYVAVGEGSGKTNTRVKTIDKYSNFCTQLRKDADLSDQAVAEKIEFQINGNYSWDYVQAHFDNLAAEYEREYYMMEGKQANNLTTGESSTNGVITQVQANGITNSYTNFGIAATYGSISRQLDNMGAPAEYDQLMDSYQFQDCQNGISTEYNNGAIIYDENGRTGGGIDFKRDFSSVKIFRRKYNLIPYSIFDETTTFGSSGLGLRQNFGLFIPRGKMSGGRDASLAQTEVLLPRFTVMYQKPFGGNKWYYAQTGLGADIPTSPTAEVVRTIIGYFGIRVHGASQYLINTKSS
jgi:hypothetical protein